jgi:acetyl-CoA acetyltransferase
VLAQVQYGSPIHTELPAFFATTAAFGERDGGAVTASRRLFGAAAVLVTSLERARDLAQPAVRVLGQVQYGAPIHTELSAFFATTAAFGERDGGAVTASARLFGGAGVTPADVDVALIVEPFTIAVPLALEQYGFCAMGEGGPFIESGATRWPDGALPVNTHGGSNGEAFVHGANHLPEAVRQIRGHACNQVAGAELAFVCGAISDPSGAVLLGADR